MNIGVIEHNIKNELERFCLVVKYVKVVLYKYRLLINKVVIVAIELLLLHLRVPI